MTVVLILATLVHPRQLLLRCSTSYIHVVVPIVHGVVRNGKSNLGKKWQKFAPRQLLLRCSTSYIHVVVPIVHGVVRNGKSNLGKKWQKFAPRQLLLRCPNKLHPCNDAISALPPSMAVERSELVSCQIQRAFSI